MKIDTAAGATPLGQTIGMSSETMVGAIEDALEKSRVGSWKGVPLSEAPAVDNLAALPLDEVFAFIMEDQTQIDYPKLT